MNKRVRTVAAVVAMAVAMVSAGASAQDRNGQCAGQSSNGSSSREQQFCFEGESVSGTREGAGGANLRPVRRVQSGSLLRLRAHFVPEMLKSVEGL